MGRTPSAALEIALLVAYVAGMLRYVTVAVVALAATPSAAHAVKCSGDRYGAIDRAAFPTVGSLKAIGLPKKTDGYAPRCLVAESVAGLVQRSWRDEGDDGWSFAATVRPRGARWNGGTWKCQYVPQGENIPDVGYVEWVDAACHRKGRSSQRVTFELGS